MFCKNCLSQSLRFNNKCAICRSKIKPETISLVSISTSEENNLVRQITRTLSNPTVPNVPDVPIPPPPPPRRRQSIQSSRDEEIEISRERRDVLEEARRRFATRQSAIQASRRAQETARRAAIQAGRLAASAAIRAESRNETEQVIPPPYVPAVPAVPAAPAAAVAAPAVAAPNVQSPVPQSTSIIEERRQALRAAELARELDLEEARAEIRHILSLIHI